MIPPVNDPVWKKLVTGEKKIVTSQLAINMLLKNNQIAYGKDASAPNVTKLVQHTHEFFAKYETVFGGELKQIL